MAESKVAIITGAGSGVGRDTALLLAESGYAVVLVGRTQSKLDQTAEALSAESNGQARHLTVSADLAEADGAAKVVERTLEEFERIDAVANVAGVAPLGPIEKTTYEGWRQCIDANLTAVVMMTTATWPTFRKQKAGTIVNVSSMASIDPFPGFSMYAAAKVGVNMYTRCTADEGRKIGVNAVAVAPGAIETAMLRDNFNEKMIPQDKTLDPASVAALIRDCITGEKKFDSGETIEMPSP